MIYRIKADKLTINNTRSNYKSCVYVAPAKDADLSGLGRLFIIVEAKSREKKIPAILNQIVDELSEYYYHSPTKNTEAALETTAQYFNENIIDITNKDLKWIKDKISILIAAIDKNKLIISNYNNIKLWMFRDNKIHDITSNQNENKKPIGKKILSQLISGQLNNEDILLLTNGAIFDYFSDDKIKKTITTLAPTQACAFFKNTLLDYNTNVDFSSIIIKLQTFKKEPQQIEDVSHKNILIPDDEVEKINQVEPKLVKKYLIFITFWWSKIFKGINDLIKSKLAKKKEKQTVIDVTKNNNENKQTTKEEQINWLEKIKKFSFLKYRLLLLILIIAGLFIGSLFMINNKKQTQEKNEHFQTTIDEINKKINSIEAALIYKDNDRAEKLLSDSRELLATLQGETAEQQYIYQETKNKIEKQINKIYKLKKIESPNIIANLPNNFKTTSNLFIDNNNIIYLANNNIIYKINSKNKTVDELATVSDKINKIFNFEKNKLLLTGENGRIWLMDTNNYSIREINLEPINEKSKIKNIANYGKNIYALDIGNNNIYKYKYTNSVFSKAIPWLKQDLDITNNDNIIIDGNVWLTNNQGKISKFFKGKKEVFNIKGAYDTINNEIFLWTNETVNNLYLIDKNKNRIIISDKNGKVNQQLLGDDLEEIKAIITNSNETKLYIMTDNKIYQINL